MSTYHPPTERADPVASLFVDWLIAKVALAEEFWACCAEDLDPLRDEAKVRAIELGISWSDWIQTISEGTVSDD